MSLDLKRAVAYNKKGTITFYDSEHKPDSEDFARDVYAFQVSNKLTADGMCGPSTIAASRLKKMSNSSPVAKEDIYDDIAKICSRFEGKYWSMNKDGEFRGLFDRSGKKHWASGKYHIGLSFGYIQFTQDGGALGKLLVAMKAKNATKFKKIFGDLSEDLIKMTNSAKGEAVNGRSRRVQKLGGHDLWEEPWVKRFTEAGKDEEFQEVQRAVAIRDYMLPAVATCKEFGMKSDRALAFAFDRSVQFGTSGARNSFNMHFNKKQDEYQQMYNYWNKFKDERWAHRSGQIWSMNDLKDVQWK